MLGYLQGTAKRETWAGTEARPAPARGSLLHAGHVRGDLHRRFVLNEVRSGPDLEVGRFDHGCSSGKSGSSTITVRAVRRGTPVLQGFRDTPSLSVVHRWRVNPIGGTS